MKRRTGMKSAQEPAKTASRPLSRNRFDAFMSICAITAFVKPRSSELP